MLRTLFVFALLVSVVSLVGCGGTPTTKSQASEGDKSEIEKNLAKLPEKDQKLAREQKTCPVGGEPLGSMGVPVKVTVADQDVFICCKSCEKDLKADPEKYLAKLKN